ncbi:MAG: hypothetical protein RIR79_2232 [Pseudomonadota bacterium]
MNSTMNTMNSTTAIILFAHGSRDPLWHKPMEAVQAQLAVQAPYTQVECAYLELSTPDLPTAVQKLVDAGAKTISIVPLFLGVGKHAREDLPQLVADLRRQHPQITFTLKSAVGEDTRLIALLADIAQENP